MLAPQLTTAMPESKSPSSTGRLALLRSDSMKERVTVERNPENRTFDEDARPAAYDFGKIPIVDPQQNMGIQAPRPISTQPSGGMLQAKLSVGWVDDPLEHEADRVADQVMTQSGESGSVSYGSPPTVQRKCSACAEEDQEKVLRKESASAPMACPVAPPSVGTFYDPAGTLSMQRLGPISNQGLVWTSAAFAFIAMPMQQNQRMR